MDNFKWEEWSEPRRQLIAEMLREKNDYHETVSRLHDMYKTEFPNGVFPRGDASITVRRIIEELKYGTFNTYNIVIAETYNAAPIMPPAAASKVEKKKPLKTEKKVSLNFRLVRDDRLDLADRIIFSLAWKWTFCNDKNDQQPKAHRPCDYRKFTRFRPNTIKTSLATLILYGYINENHEPLVTKSAPDKDGKRITTLNNGIPYMKYRKMTFANTGDIKENVFNGVMATNYEGYMNYPSWMCKALGVSLRTARRYRNEK